MSLAELHDHLQSLATAGTPLPIGATAISQAGLTPRPGLDALLRSRLLLISDLQVTASGAIPPPAGGALHLSGTTSVLGAPGAQADIAFLQDGNGPVDVRVAVQPAGSWRLGAAFPILGGRPFDELELGSAAYVVTTAAGDSYDWNGSAQTLAPGAQLFAIVTLDGPLGVVAALLDGAKNTDTVELTGMVDPSDPSGKAGPVPALALTAPIGHDVGVPHLELTSPRIELTSLADAKGRRLAWLTFATTLVAESQPLFDLKAAVNGSGGSLTFGLVPLPPPAPAVTPDRIAALLGGYDYRTFVPQDSELQKIFDGVAVRGLDVAVDLAGPSVDSVIAEIGSNGPWGPWGPPEVAATIKDLALTMMVVRPFPAPEVMISFEATASILPKVFNGDFVVDMTYDLDSKDVAVAAGFVGVLSINELIGGLSGGAVTVPDDLLSMSFSDFGLTFSKPGGAQADYTLYGKAELGFPLPFLGVHVDSELQAYVDSAAKSYKLRGTLTLGGSVFDGEADIVAGKTQLTAGWAALAPEDRLGIATIVSAIGLTPPQIPDGLDLDLESAQMGYTVDSRLLVLEAKSATYGEAVFAASSAKAPTKYFAGVKVDHPIELVNLPLLKGVLGGSGRLAVDGIQVLASSPLAADDVALLAPHIDAGYPQPPAIGMQGLALTMTLDAGTYQLPLSLVVGGAAQSPAQMAGPPANAATPAVGAPATAGPAPPPPPSDGTAWFNLQKTFGPMAFQKVGIRYADSVLWFLMNASLSAGGLTISVYGLGAGSKLTTFEPHFTISGLGVTVSEGPVEISGALLGTIDPVNFYGELLIGAESFSLGALGGYATVDGHPSFFGYLVLDAPLGGPPFFFVTGLAGGVGFNRQLVIPQVDGVAAFPLVAWATGSGSPPSSTPGTDVGAQVAQVVGRLSQVVYPSLGEYWLAAGVHFTTFKVLDCFALVVAKLGSEFEVALLGMATVQVPPAPSPAVANAQLALEASYAPSTGLLAIGGQLTPASFVLDPACHLTGGFAFWSWVSGAHEGEIVVTLGGYSPRFTPPDYYPQVPRLGLSWKRDALTIQGGLYFALTSSAVMAGGSLDATWQQGDIRAWFDVQADFLIVFEPFHYYISAGIQLGASFSVNLLFTRATMTIHLGVDVEIWGPEFTGRATVDLSIVSFTVTFGASGQQTDTTIAWSDFVARLLPHDTPPPKQVARTLPEDEPAAKPAIVQIVVAAGTLKQLDGEGGIDFVADAERLRLVTRSAIPAKQWSTSANLTVRTPPGVTPSSDFGIGPTGTPAAAFNPTHDVQITTTTDRRFVGTPDLRNAAKALWQTRQFDGNGVPQGVDPVNDTTIADVPHGLVIDPEVRDPDHTRPVPLEQLLYTEDKHVARFDWSASAGPATDPFSGETVPGTIVAPLAEHNRSLLVAELAGEGMSMPADIDVSELASQAAFDLLEPPALRLLGEQR